ncbi:hypothetical protein V5H98_01500 [Georgenia sp. M64]|uniref:hypothetical protein n=1 Tax=Georgenia sp. M64 TaxID=3120520 RepID=UPI0030E0C8E3
MEADEFGGPALVLGSVRGRRSFGVRADGHLTGVFHTQVWHPGENLARCRRDGGVVERRPDGRIVVRTSSSREIGTGHGLGGCTCGFYAYYQQDPYTAHRRLSGVVEGYGRVVLGTAGFRAEKARILALLLPAEPAFDVRGPGAPGQPVHLDDVEPVERREADVTRIRSTYRDVAFFAREDDMLAAYPPTERGPEV